MKTHDVFMSHPAFPCALSLGCWSGRTEIILASTVLLTSAAVDAVVHFHSRWWSWVWNPEGCCHAVTLISESSSTFSYTDSHVFCCSFHFPLRKILENYEGVKSAFSVRFWRILKHRSIVEVYALRDDLHNGAACWMQVAGLGTQKTSPGDRPFAKSVSPRLKDHRRSQRKRRRWRA